MSERNEDWMLDEDFRVESASDFLNDLDEEERDFLYNSSGMKVCENCGEWVSRENLKTSYDGRKLCNLCLKSDFHQKKRGSSHTASENLKSDVELLREFNNRY